MACCTTYVVDTAQSGQDSRGAPLHENAGKPLGEFMQYCAMQCPLGVVLGIHKPQCPEPFPVWWHCYTVPETGKGTWIWCGTIPLMV